MHAPSEHHFQAVKRILRYIKGTLHFGLKITPSTTFNISAFSDADWLAVQIPVDQHLNMPSS
jgi:hypothetical protein